MSTLQAELIQPEFEISVDEVNNFVLELTKGLEITTQENLAISEFGFSTSASIKDLVRQTIYYVLEQLYQNHLGLLAFEKLNGNWGGYHHNQRIYKIFKEWSSGNYSAENREIIESAKKAAKGYFRQQIHTHLGELGFKQKVFDYGLNANQIIKLIDACDRSITAHGHEREYVERENLAAILKESHSTPGKQKAIIEFSPPVYEYQSELMVRIYHFIGGVWKVKIVSLPFFGNNQTQDLQKTTVRLLHHILKYDKKIVCTKFMNDFEQNEILSRLLVVERKSIDVDNIFTGILNAYSHIHGIDLEYQQLVADSNSAVEKIDAVMEDVEPFIEDSIENLPNLLDTDKLKNKSKTLKKLIAGSSSIQMTDAEFAEQEWTAAEADSYRRGLISSIIEGKDAEFVESTGGGKSLAYSSSGECSTIQTSYSFSNQSGAPTTMSQFQVEVDKKGVPWKTILDEDGNIKKLAKCDCGAETWFDPCEPQQICRNCGSTCEQKRIASEAGAYLHKRNKVYPQANTSDNPWLDNLFTGFFSYFIPNVKYQINPDLFPEN